MQWTRKSKRYSIVSSTSISSNVKTSISKLSFDISLEIIIWQSHHLLGTLTTPVQLIKCLQAIKDYAFYASEYPVVATFEDHFNSDLQAKVAQMVTRTFGDMSFYPESNLKEFPSLEFLKKIILISTKPPKVFREFQRMEVKGNTQKVKASTEEKPWENENLAVGNEIKTDDTVNVNSVNFSLTVSALHVTNLITVSRLLTG
ncbi:unnamed protein product [Ilex paraguariensis]|uniref:Phosphatidylinositol-specific phospholipase C X domain-containing protein n=1 Tax=Ilex paraguariensis TaxID=185542 RepID=A0ABC8R333_9AQUA